MIKYFLIFFLLILTGATASGADFSCRKKAPKWSRTQPPINLKHIFCGEIDHRGRPKGFHSSQMLEATPKVKEIFKKQSLRKGIYNARVKFSNDRTKFSTFFPDQCSIKDITRSVVYAASNRTKKHHQWGILGPSAPQKNAKGFCLDKNGKPFTIRMGLTRNHRRITTAFPQP
jgi:hypothetical protein